MNEDLGKVLNSIQLVFVGVSWEMEGMLNYVQNLLASWFLDYFLSYIFRHDIVISCLNSPIEWLPQTVLSDTINSFDLLSLQRHIWMTYMVTCPFCVMFHVSRMIGNWYAMPCMPVLLICCCSRARIFLLSFFWPFQCFLIEGSFGSYLSTSSWRVFIRLVLVWSSSLWRGCPFGVCISYRNSMIFIVLSYQICGM